jgi:hypothetical protein
MVTVINTQYAREMHQQFGYFTTWLPNLKLELGAIGEVRDQMFEPVSSLGLQGIPFDVIKDRQPIDITYTSSDSVSIEARLSGDGSTELGPEARGRIIVAFKHANAVAFQAAGCVGSHIADVTALGQEILARFKRGIWSPAHVVVTDLIAVENATILISNGQNAHIEVGIKTNLVPDAFALASADVKATVIRSVGIGTRIIGEKGLTPLFRAAGIKRRAFRDSSFTRRQRDDVGFSELNYKELINWR